MDQNFPFFRSNGSSNGEFAPQWSMELRQNSMDQNSVGSQDSSQFPNYDIPKACNIKETGPPLTPKKNSGLKRMVVATPCACDAGQPIQSYENYDIPKHVTQVLFEKEYFDLFEISVHLVCLFW